MPTIFVALLTLIRVVFYSQQPDASYSNIHVPADSKVNVELGVPTDADPTDDFIIARHQYVLSYNKNRNVPNWVCWNYSKKWVGTFTRSQVPFKQEPELPDSFTTVTTKDYTGSGYDRGHMTASDERTKTKADNLATFYISNVLAQESDLNKGVWRDMEVWCNKMVKDSAAELYIVSGGIFKSGKMLKHKIAVPDSCFKIVVVLKKGQGLANVTANTRIETVIMPNKAGIRHDKWQKYKRTVRDVEAATGYDILTAVPKSVQDIIEGRQ